MTILVLYKSFTLLILMQFVTEKAGKAEAVTEYDSEFEGLCQQLDQIKLATEHMLTHVESIVQPNPSK